MAEVGHLVRVRVGDGAGAGAGAGDGAGAGARARVREGVQAQVVREADQQVGEPQ